MSVDLTIRVRIGGDHAAEGVVEVTSKLLVEPQSRDNSNVGAAFRGAIDGRPVGGTEGQEERAVEHVRVANPLDKRDGGPRNFAQQEWAGFLASVNRLNDSGLGALGQGYSSNGFGNLALDPAAA